MKSSVISYGYDRSKVRAGILHIGVGNFHRAHQEFYTNRLLEYPDQHGWGICGAMLLPGDERLYRILKKQGQEYTLTVCGRDGHDEAYRIGSLVELLWAGGKSGGRTGQDSGQEHPYHHHDHHGGWLQY